MIVRPPPVFDALADADRDSGTEPVLDRRVEGLVEPDRWGERDSEASADSDTARDSDAAKDSDAIADADTDALAETDATDAE